MPSPSHLLLLIIILHATLIIHASPPPFNHPDLNALLSFKASSDISNTLSSWNISLDPCGTNTFLGVTCLHNRVTSLVLVGLGLHGSFESLTGIDKLRVLSLKDNYLTGPFPDFSNLTSLKLLFLSGNRISGEFPRVLPDLFRLDLANNDIYGEIPVTVNKLTRLLTLRLERNRVSGSIHFMNITSLRDFNISGNNVSGEIPASLSGFPGSVFGNNPVLCGFPLLECAPPKIPSSVVSSTPTSVPWTAVVPKRPGNSHKGGKISTLAIAAIIIGDVLVLALVSLLLYCYFAGEKTSAKNNKDNFEGEKMIYVNSGVNSFEKGRMVFFDDARKFELEDLLRASAEMLGKGGLGTAYKASLDDGNVVVVKRLKEVVVSGGKREFEQQMEVLGRLRHPNVVSLKAYYFAKDEKLIVCDYMTNGNLFWLLHGNRGPGRTPLDWSTRLKIAAGAARGLAFIHTFGSPLKLTHGNIKSTNILLDDSNNARVSDFGLSSITPQSAILRSAGYRAPELSLSNTRKPTQKSDVYSFGVLLMELLTGKCPTMTDSGEVVDLPRWVQGVAREEWTKEVFDLELMSYRDIEGEMVGLLDIAILCASETSDQRPMMENVVKMIQDIEGFETSLRHDVVDVVSDPPSVIEA